MKRKRKRVVDPVLDRIIYHSNSSGGVVLIILELSPADTPFMVRLPSMLRSLADSIEQGVYGDAWET